jgi:Arc/MetJ-type ribon-helix-helix transcriptional regulator
LQLVSGTAKAGMYQTTSEAIREGLRLLNERDHRLSKHRAENGLDSRPSTVASSPNMTKQQSSSLARA